MLSTKAVAADGKEGMVQVSRDKQEEWQIVKEEKTKKCRFHKICVENVL